MYKRIFAVMLLLLPFAANSQNSSINTFSPYTFYGLGDMPVRTNAATAGMAGVGVASWSPYSVNMLNPAAHASAMPHSVVFGFGLSGKNDYLSSSTTKSSYNSFNISNIAVMFPIISGKIGFAMSLAPFSTVGYTVEQWENNPGVTTDLGLVKYKYSGEGNISLGKAGIGAQVAEGLSVGVEMLYYVGTLSRVFSQEITPVTTGSYNNVSVLLREEISSVHWGLGAQYDAIRKPDRILTAGATWQPGGALRNRHSQEISSTAENGSIYSASEKTRIDFGGRLALGLFYRSNKLTAGADFTHQDWSGSFAPSAQDNVSYRAMNVYNIGVQYIPNAIDVRRPMNRWAYRAGLKYTDTYLKKNGKGINDIAVTAGIGIPIRQDGTEMSLGLEGGRMGTETGGLIRDSYIKVSLGISIVSGRWFEKRKFN